MASSPADREYILNKIVNKTEFNLKLQELVFGAWLERENQWRFPWLSVPRQSIFKGRLGLQVIHLNLLK